MNSFIRCCLDKHLIYRWICIDDNSHETDRKVMQVLYPFMEFVWKTPESTGHAKSMNIAQKMITSRYVIALEDDWQFVTKMNYIERAQSVFDKEPDSVKQVFFNRHYIEVPDEAYLAVTGGFLKKDYSGRRYYVHEYIPKGPVEPQQFFARQPHFALRPSFFKRDMWRKVGEFNECAGVTEFEYFENEYARRYVAEGFVSCYFDGVYCIHTGRLNRDRENPNAPPNAYQLNNMEQYGQLWPNKMVGKSSKTTTERIAFAITSTKNTSTVSIVWSVCSRLSMVKDPSLIDRFILVGEYDDIVRSCFPFFEFAEQNGTAKRMNVLLNKCEDCDYIFYGGDEFTVLEQFSLSDMIYVIKKGEYDQVMLPRLKLPNVKPQQREIENITVFHNVTSSEECWWPNFSLVPCLLKKASLKTERFNEDIDPSFVVYDMGYRLWKNNNYSTCSLGLNVEY